MKKVLERVLRTYYKIIYDTKRIRFLQVLNDSVVSTDDMLSYAIAHKGFVSFVYEVLNIFYIVK